MDIAWAYSLYTVQLIDNSIYGATVLGGNILRTELNGTSKIIWENDYADPHKGGVFLYSLIFNKKLYLFPYVSEYIVIYDTETQEIVKIRLDGKGKEEKIYPHIYQGKILMFGLDSGSVWELRDETVSAIYDNHEDVKLFKYRGIREEQYVLFYGTEKKTAALFDCRNQHWTYITAPDFITGGFSENTVIWYIAGKRLFSQDIKSNYCDEVLSISDGCTGASIINKNIDEILVVENSGDKTFLVNKATKIVEEKRIDFFLKGNLHTVVDLENGYLMLADYRKLDWMLWAGDKYAICNTADMSVNGIPIFNMNSKSKRMIEERYANIAWNMTSGNIICENEKEGLSFLLESLALDIF